MVMFQEITIRKAELTGRHTGTQFQEGSVPVFKKLFSKEEIIFDDMC